MFNVKKKDIIFNFKFKFGFLIILNVKELINL